MYEKAQAIHISVDRLVWAIGEWEGVGARESRPRYHPQRLAEPRLGAIPERNGRQDHCRGLSVRQAHLTRSATKPKSRITPTRLPFAGFAMVPPW